MLWQMSACIRTNVVIGVALHHYGPDLSKPLCKMRHTSSCLPQHGEGIDSPASIGAKPTPTWRRVNTATEVGNRHEAINRIVLVLMCVRGIVNPLTRLWNRSHTLSSKQE
jgi:hypothetical protein